MNEEQEPEILSKLIKQKLPKPRKKRINKPKPILDETHIQTKTPPKTRKSHTTTVDKIQVINEMIWVSFD